MKQPIKNFITDYLAELVLGNAAIFAGAGLSVPAGYVDWRALLRPLSKDLELDIDLESDLVAVAQFHVNSRAQNRHKLHEALLDALSRDAESTENHQLLSQLPITTFWTTNYDKLIENTLHKNGKVVDVKSSVPQLATTRPNRDVTIFKMHGDIDRPDEAVVTKDDYERYAREREPFIIALAGDLVKKTFLFLGFSFSDPNLDHVLAQVRLNFTTNQRQHYAVFRSRKKPP
jgi:NAD-dependent SIR2 family protein deacetylase